MLIASHDEDFQGVAGIENFASNQRPGMPIQNIKPKPSSWIQTAAVSWFDKNGVEDLPNYMEMPSNFTTSAEPSYL